MDPVFDILIRTFWAIGVSIGFAVLFNTPRRALWVVALLGAAGFGAKEILVYFLFQDEDIFACLVGASLVGVSGVYFAHRVHTPPIVFTVPAVINMIPGKLGYEFVMGLLTIVNEKNFDADSFPHLMLVLNNGLKTALILMSLAFGIIFPILVFNTQTVKDKDLNKVIRDKIFRRIKILNYRIQRKKRHS